jgi:D-threo-aldose 1-dehydrogenase
MRTRVLKRPSGKLTFTEMGMGTAPLGNLYREISGEEARASLEAAWRGGVRYYDTAPLYGLGLAETRLNPFLRSKRRDEMILATKIGRMLKVSPPGERFGIGLLYNTPTRAVVFDYTHDAVMRSLETSLERLGVDSVDVLYAHNLDVRAHGAKDAMMERIDELMGSGYHAMIELRDQGVVKAIGAGVDEWEPAQILAERGDFDVFLLAGRYTLLEQEALATFLPLCQKRGIGITVGGPFNSGILATGARPGAYYDYQPAKPETLARVGRIEAVCKVHNVRLIDAALRFPLMHPSVVSVIAGGQTSAEVTANLAALDRQIPPAFWAALKVEGLLREDAPTS